MNLVIAGAFSKFKELSVFFLENKIYKRNKITVYDGINECSWNGGRINRKVYWSQSQIDFYYNRDIGIGLTFTNHEININDKVGLSLLDKFHISGNKIILINDHLREFIRKNYPYYRLTYSVTGVGHIPIPLNDEALDIYKDLEAKYDLIVPRMEHVFDVRFKELDQSKYEIMLNDTCIYNCPHYTEHFMAIATQNLLRRNYKGHEEIEECWIDGYDFKKSKNGKHGMDLCLEQIRVLQKQGINSFKLSGRELNSEEFVNELRYYARW
ncbi:MAG: hypothetical protein A2504_06975 [Bdellovibrionales bacterium RIFOXYD12_FULL_39_22]|nr:MAG: hypothetical protein A2385_05190 [Bdellovibrionales bacterium RIFOXYB1_FULL_39_21]OFZ44317.1 MAG: hypothetical protein A2485_15970 [Bdellovibrionales bacterium RIFOXYC12_FULL_39_17]OFZ49172.1 MAG: hypothetical protein A2404_15910 [Bdellovibrionales bacterium RIFOXYC1_FULL_39_130]OFZ76980.1 MAG: hypothetical protein A2560_10995 [Bdellovibrionales bacterium RIFOXYD1_FULL_39_84]OFZ95193.1 MAG: hypothetical protein A2504_06975 [Bdellovibrionales bacterium RIFOXYD12_FULL_39_22]HLE09654.1 hy